MKFFEAFSFVSVISIVQARVGTADTVPFYGLGLSLSPEVIASLSTPVVLTETGGVKRKLGNGSIKAEFLKTVLGRLLKHRDRSQHFTGKNIFAYNLKVLVVY